MLPDLAIAPVRRVLYGQEAIIYSCSVSRVEVQVFLARCTVITTICSEWLCSACLDIQLDSPLIWLAPAPSDREPLQNSPRSSFLEVPALSGRDLVAPTCARVEAGDRTHYPIFRLGGVGALTPLIGFSSFTIAKLYALVLHLTLDSLVAQLKCWTIQQEALRRLTQYQPEQSALLTSTIPTTVKPMFNERRLVE